MQPGTTIGHYRLGDLLGRGGMGDVYRATDVRLGRDVAVKFMSRFRGTDPGAKERFIREARAASALEHPNICTIHDIGETPEGDLYLVMALYEGETLAQRLARGPLPVPLVHHVLTQTARALKRAHAAGIIHRDIKPENMMLTGDDEVRLLDFGLAKLQSAESLTATGASMGTVAYMSPEQAMAEPVTPATDVWSLGVVGWQMLAGRLPFRGDHPVAMMRSILHDEPEPISALRDDVPPALEAVLARAMAKAAADRYPSAAEFLAALDGTGAPADADARPAVPGERRASPAQVPAPSHGSRRPWLVGAAVLVSLVAVGAFAARGRFGGAADTAAAREDVRDVIAVLPFTVRGAPELAYLAEGLVDLVSGKLDGAGPLRTVDPRAVVGRVRDRQLGDLDPAAGGDLARSLGAGRFVLGQVVGVGQRLSITARLYDSDGREAAPVVSIEGSSDSAFTLVDQLVTDLLASTLAGANARVQRSAAQSSHSLAATREFLRGEQFHRRGQFDSASTAYNRAIALDSTFALAHLMKSMNNAYTYDTDDYAAAVKADALAGDLPERDRGMISAFLDQQAGRLDVAERKWIAHLQRYPDEVKALLWLGMLYYRANGRWGRPLEQARPYFERVIALEPENIPALHQLARLDAAAGYADSLVLRARILERVAPSSEWATDVSTMAMYTIHDSAQIARFVSTVSDEPLLVRLFAAYNAMRFSPDPADAGRLLAQMRGRQVNPRTGLPEGVEIGADLTRWVSLVHDIVNGRYDGLRRHLVDPATSRTAAWDVWDAELVAANLFPVDSALLARITTRLAAVDPAARMASKFEPLHDIFTTDIARLERDYTLATLLAMQGRSDEAWAIQRRLAALPPFPAFASLHEDVPKALAARLHYIAGDQQRALTLLRTLKYQLPQTANSLAITSGSAARFLRAELEFAIGDAEVARGFYAGLVEEFTPADKLYLAASYERLGRIADRAGRNAEAVSYYERFLRAWSGADAALVPQRQDIEARVAALRGGMG